MSRQTYLSKDFFVDASETAVKDCILQLPQSVSNIKFVAEDPVRHSLKFVLDGDDKLPDNLVDVALLPLGAGQTRITLHGSYVDGTAIKEAGVSNTLKNFELAITAAIKGTLHEYQPTGIQIHSLKDRLKFFLFVSALLCIICILGLFLG